MIQGLLTRPKTDEIVSAFVENGAGGTFHTDGPKFKSVDLNKPIACFGVLRGTGDIMKKANRIWKLRKKWESFQKDGKNYNVFNEEQAMMEEVEDFIAQGQKINAIKVYRNKMKEIYGTKLGLRECKDYIDSLQVDLNKKGVIK